MTDSLKPEAVGCPQLRNPKGCQLHNVHCTYPACTRTTPQPDTGGAGLAHRLLGEFCACYGEAWPAKTCETEAKRLSDWLTANAGDSEKTVSALCDMARLARAVLEANPDDMAARFGAREALGDASWKLSDTLINAAVQLCAQSEAAARITALERQVEGMREALEPFAALARVRYPDEGGAPSWIDIMTGNGECDELELRSHVAMGRHSEILDAGDFRRAAEVIAALSPAQSGEGG